MRASMVMPEAQSHVGCQLPLQESNAKLQSPRALGKVKDHLISENKKQVKKHSDRGDKNVFRKYPGKTIVGDLATTFTAKKQSAEAVTVYDEVARAVIKESKQFRPFLGISCKRKHYRKLVREFSEDPKIK